MAMLKVRAVIAQQMIETTRLRNPSGMKGEIE
jgi:hypothetical protein